MVVQTTETGCFHELSGKGERRPLVFLHSVSSMLVVLNMHNVGVMCRATKVTSLSFPIVGKMGPPRNFEANHLSPYHVQLSWSHPDENLPQMQQEQYLYNLLCNSNSANLQLSAKGSHVNLYDLTEHTKYTCYLSVLYANETADITFTTQGKNTLTFH